MKHLLLGLALLLTAPALAQTAADDAPASMLADIQEDIDASKLKRQQKYEVTLKPAAQGKGLVTLRSDELELEIRVSLAELAKAKSASPSSQKKFAEGLKYIRETQKKGATVVPFNSPQARNLDHLLAAWALPKGRVGGITWRGQPVAAYRGESYGGGPGQKVYPEGQIFYFFLPDDRPHGFFAYVNIPKPK